MLDVGHFVFFGCVASGLAALLATASTAFTVIRIIGTFYLFYLGVRIITPRFRNHGVAGARVWHGPHFLRHWNREFPCQMTG